MWPNEWPLTISRSLWPIFHAFSDFAFYFYYYFMENCHTWIIISMWQNDLYTNTSRSVWPILYGLMIKMLQYKMYPAGELRCPMTALVCHLFTCRVNIWEQNTEIEKTNGFWYDTVNQKKIFSYKIKCKQNTSFWVMLKGQWSLVLVPFFQHLLWLLYLLQVFRHLNSFVINYHTYPKIWINHFYNTCMFNFSWKLLGDWQIV